MVKYTVLFCVSMFIPLLGMNLAMSSLSENKPKFPIGDYVSLYRLPLDIQEHIGKLVVEIKGVDFGAIDCYEKFISYTCNPAEESWRKYCVDDEKPVTNITKEGMCYGYKQKGIEICPLRHNSAALLITKFNSDCSYSRHANESEQICEQYRSYDIKLIAQPFSRHANLFLTSDCYSQVVSLYTVSSGNKVYEFKVDYPFHARIAKVQFDVDCPIIRLTTAPNHFGFVNTYKFYFENPIQTLLKSMLKSTNFIWKEALILSALYENSKKYKFTKIEKGSIDYCIYKNMIKKIHEKSLIKKEHEEPLNISESSIVSFFKTYLNVRCD